MHGAMRTRTMPLWIGLSVPFVFSLSGCAARQKVTYGLGDVRTLTGGTLSQYRLLVRRFEDQRDPEAISRRGSWSEAAKTADGNYYVNSDNQYVDGPVAAAVTRMIGEHVKASGLFHDVLVSESEPVQGDLVLNGAIKRFEAHRETHEVQEALLVQGGLLWLILGTASWRAQYDATTQLADVKLTDSSSSLALWQGTAEGHVAGQDMVQSGGWSVYQEANLSLKNAVDKLLEQLATVKPSPFAPPVVAKPQE